MRQHTRAGGYEARSGARWGKDVWASGEFSSQGDAQTGPSGTSDGYNRCHCRGFHVGQ